jgi:signal peptidase I
LLSTLLIAALGGCRPGPEFTVVMQDSAMEPTYAAHDAIRFQPASQVARGQVIAFEYPFTYPGRPRRELIARVIGLPGDRLALGPEGVLVDGARLVEPYAKNQQAVAASELSVPPGAYFVLGDDRHNQRDSRWWGPLPADRVLGVAVAQR